MIDLKFNCYHYINRSDEFKRIWGHDFDLFNKHIIETLNDFNPLALDQIDIIIKNRNINDGRYVFFTFDDGLKEHIELIAPLLRKKNIRATFFVPSCILYREPMIPQVIHFGMALYGVRKFYELLKKHFLKFDLNYLDLLGNSEKDVYTLMAKIKKIFRDELPLKTSYRVLLSIWKNELEKDVPNIFDRVYMSEKDIKQLILMGHEIGVHTKIHPVINDQTFSMELFDSDILQPKRDLERITNKSIIYFAYPYGLEDFVLYDEKNLRKLNDIGLSYIFTTFKKDDNFVSNFIGRNLVYTNKIRDTKGSATLKNKEDFKYKISVF